MTHCLRWLVLFLCISSMSFAQTTVFVNEFHYDNSGTDQGEFVEIAGPAGMTLSDWSLSFYNGNGGLLYTTKPLTGTLSNSGSLGFITINLPTNGIQNGSPDGFALVNDGTVVQFLSYEGSFTADDGPAAGQTSRDVGVSESSDTPVGFSLQLTGSGTTYEDFTWADPASETPGAANNDQTFGGGSSDNPPMVTSTAPADGAINVLTDAEPIITFSEAVTASGAWFSVAGTTSGDITDAYTAGGGPQTYTLSFTGPTGRPAAGETVTVTVLAANVTDQDGTPDNLAADFSLSYTTANPLTTTPIYTIQAAGHTSPLLGSQVTTSGIVTALDGNGFYLQDAVGDGNDATADALFTFTGSAHSVAIGDEVTVTGTVSEFTPGGVSTNNLSTTQISGSPAVTVLSSGNALPPPVILGAAGRVPPSEVIDDDQAALYNVQNGEGTYEPATDGIDFFESLEGMLVTVPEALVVAPTNGFGEIFTVADNGAAATGLSSRGTLNISPDDFNPEKIQIDPDTDVSGFDAPEVSVGAQLGNVTGVVGYAFGNFEVIPTEDFTAQMQASALVVESTEIAGTADQVTVATFNVLNLDPNDTDGDTDVADGQFTGIASRIVTNLSSPDVIALQEVQDNDGSANTSVTAADQTLQLLVNEIAAAGGSAYQFIDNTFIGNNTNGGQPGGNIRTAFLYNPARVSLVPGSVQSIADDTQKTDPDNPFFNSRLPLVATFTFNGEEVTIINNHLSSKGGSVPILGRIQSFTDQQENPGVNGSLDERIDQATAVKAFVDGLLAANMTANVVVLGDFNEFEFISPVEDILGASLTNLTLTLPENERYTFNFQGNSQSLDHILVSNRLAGTAQFDAVHVNSEIPDSQAASDHDPLIAGLTLSTEPSSFQLQILHASDLEGGVDAIDNAPNFAAIVDTLEGQAVNTIILSSGDNYIPGPFFGAAGDAGLRPALQSVYQDLFNEAALTNIREGEGRVDITIMNIVGFDASALGNHELDAGTNAFGGLISPDIRGSGLGDVRWLGAQFPYLSANLNFSNDANVSGLFTDRILPVDSFASRPDNLAAAQAAPKIAPATIITRGGEQIGVVGATTQLLESITSNGGIEVVGENQNNMPALAAILQPTINALRAQGIDKIILTTHLQQVALEKELITLLSGVDIVLAGGSDVLFAQDDDPLRAGDTKAEDYPFVTQNADGEPALVVGTDGEYSYVGRLLVAFDANGVLIPASFNNPESGAFATIPSVVANLYGSDDPFANGTKGELVQRLTNAVSTIVTAQDGNILGKTNVFLDGRRSQVRTQETNLGDLTADANLATARAVDNEVVASIKNGGGIRAAIGEIVDLGGGNVQFSPPQANPEAGKEEGELSQLDIVNSLRFNNGLTILSLSAADLKAVLENGVAASTPGSTPGQFPQVGGLRFSYDPAKAPGSRIQRVALINDTGNETEVLVANGAVRGDAAREFKVVTLDFLASGGDGYPFPALGQDRVDLSTLGLSAGAATFANAGSEQDALAEYLVANFSTNPFDVSETPVAQDRRIINLEEQNDVPSITFLSLIDATTDRDLLSLRDGDAIDIESFNLRQFSVQARVNGEVNRVQFDLRGPVRISRSDFTAPYALFQEQNGNFFGREAVAGDYTLTATPFIIQQGRRVLGTPVRIQFSLTAGEDPLRIFNFRLVEAPSGAFVQNIQQGDVLDLASLPEQVNILARVTFSNLSQGSVVLDLTGPLAQRTVQNGAPYALFSDNMGQLPGRQLVPGNYTLTGQKYRGEGGNSFRGVERRLSFTVIDSRASRLQVYPNVFDEELLIRTDESTDQMQIRLQNIQGVPQPIHAKARSVTKEGVRLDTRTVPAGHYILQVIRPGHSTETLHLIKK